MRKNLQQFLTVTKRHKHLTTVLVVPYTTKVTQVFKSYTLIKTVPNNEVFNDITRPRLVCLNTNFTASTVKFTAQEHKSTITATVAGIKTQVLLDSGATGTAFISERFCTQHGISTTPTKQSVTLGDDSTVECNKLAQVPIRIGNIKFNLECLCIPGLLARPLILGTPWLQQFAANIDFMAQTVTITRGHKSMVINMWEPSPSPSNMSDTPENVKLSEYCQLDMGKTPLITPTQEQEKGLHLLSSKKLAKLVTQDRLSDLFMVMVTPTEDNLQDQVQAHMQEDINSLAELKLKVLLEENKDLFRTELPGPSELPNQREVIPLLKDASPPVRPMYRYSKAEVDEMKRQIHNLLQAGLIEKSTSPFGAPVIFAKKKDGTLRMCIDYRGLNKITVPNRYPLPRIDDLLDKLEGSSTFSSLDLLSAYHQIKLTPQDVPKTAFRTPFGHYQYRVMPFGLTNAPSVFMAAMDDILSDLPFVAVYLDDILIFSKNREEHVNHVAQVFKRLREHGFFLKKSKCEFFKTEIKYLGHIITQDGIMPDPQKVQEVNNWTVPETVYDVRAFLGTMNYFRKFIQNYAKIARPLIDLTKGNVSRRKSATTRVQLNKEQLQAFEKLRQALSSTPVLKIPQLGEPFQVITDASDYALGAILLQDGRPIAFESRQMSPAEKGYHTTDKELLAIVHAFQTWRCYLEGAHFEVLTDHNPLTYLRTQRELSRRQARWAEKLNMFNFDTKYLPGEVNPADMLSRPRICVITTIKNKDAHAYRMPAQELVRQDNVDLIPVTLQDIQQAYKQAPLSNTDSYTLKHGVWHTTPNMQDQWVLPTNIAYGCYG